ncbi:MAG: hypothetical protein MUD01_28630 [Chloroflexaceae bacterium]|jgi:hypothetical protein|nr:hypothetical protein [Chloroflexaceae bacterium]
MASQWRQKTAALLGVGVLAASALFSGVAPAQAAPFNGTRTTSFADIGFDRTWTRTDAETVRGGRSLYWGPNPWFDYAEFYRQGVNGLRTVQYFDKARMEINDPNDRSYQEGVSNGLLVKEMVSGRAQLGNDPYDAYEYGTSDVPVAGNERKDNPNGAGYRAFANVATTDNDYRDPQRLGQRISTNIDRAGNLSQRTELALPETEIVQYNSVTGHNIPRVFWDYMNLQGRVLVNGRIVTGPVVDWLPTMGLPITDAYWTKAKVGPVEKDVLVQLFERRVLTYVPDNPAGFKVEMGNVGQHYFQWRYPHLGTPWNSPDPTPPLIYASNVFNQEKKYWELVVSRFSAGQTGPVPLTTDRAESVAFSYRRSYDPTQTRILIDSRRGDGETRQIYEIDPQYITTGQAPGGLNSPARRFSFTDGTPPPSGIWPGELPDRKVNEYNASYSPDGTKVVFISERSGKPELWIAPTNGNNPRQLTSNGCVNEVPTWSPDGRTIFWENNCTGSFQIYRADMSYQFSNPVYVEAKLVNQKQLTNNPGDNRYARVSPDGQTIAFASNRDGNYELYTMASSGGGETRLTNSGGDDDAPTWSADGRQLAFASNRSGTWQIYLMPDLRNPANTTLISDHQGESRWPLWAQ